MAKYQAYAEYKDSEVEWLGQIPKTWDISRLKYTADIFGRIGFRGYTVDDIVDEGEGALVLSPSNILGDQFSLEKKTYLSWKKYYESPEIMVELNDILLVKTGSTYGKSTIILEKKEPMTINPQMALLKKIKLEPRFLYYLFQSTLYKAIIDISNTGSGMPTMTQENINSFPIPSPDFNEALNIANFLDHETAKIDHLIEKQQQLIELLKEKRQAVISHAVTKGLNPNVPMKDSGVEWLGEVPERWSVKKLKYIVDLVGEKVESSNKQYVGMENISSKSGVFLQTEGILPEGISNTFNKGDILFGKLRPYLAKCWLADFSGICSSEFLVLRSKNKLSPIFLNLFLLTDQFIDQVNSSTYGSKMPRANWEFIGDLPIPVPDEQSSIDIANFLERQTQKYDSLIIKVSQQIALMQERRTALISAAVTGKIDVRHWQAPTVAEADTELSA